MAEPKAPSELFAETVGLADRQAAHRRALDEDRERPPELGDVYVLKVTREFAVHWVLVARDPADAELFLVIPADGHILVGSADIELPDHPALGALKLRCRFGAWIADAYLDVDGRVGVLDEVVVARARQKWMEVGHNGKNGSVLEREVDDDPEYQNWVEETLIPAREALLGLRKVVEPEPEAMVDVVKRTPRKHAYPIAASLLLATAAGGWAGMQIWRQYGQIQSLHAVSAKAEVRHRQEIEELEAERARLEDEYRQELERAGTGLAEAGELRQRIVELDAKIAALTLASTVVNPAIAYFNPPQFRTRGKVEITISPEASHVVLFLALRERSPAERYRVELRERGREEPVWSNDRLTLEEPGEIRAGVPAGILRAGEYEMTLASWDGSRFRPAAEYGLEVLN